MSDNAIPTIGATADGDAARTVDSVTAPKGFAPSEDDPSIWRMSLRTTKHSVPFALNHLVGHHLAGSVLLPPMLRVAVLRALGTRFARPVSVHRASWLHVTVDSPRNLSVGRWATVAMGCYFEGEGDVSLGDESGFGPQVTVITSAHLRRGDGYIDRQATYLPVTVGQGAWVGAGGILLPGVTLGDGVTVAAGSVVSKDCIEPGIYGGSPARRLK
jgi:maltose O-acetyltransferase